MLRERHRSLPHADAAQRVSERRPDNDDQRDGYRNEAQIGEADPQDQLVRAIGRDIEDAPKEAGLTGPARDDPSTVSSMSPMKSSTVPASHSEGEPRYRISTLINSNGSRERVIQLASMIPPSRES
jgi:hypothetical protein